MSNEAITAVSKSDIRPSGRKFVLMALADYADEEWSCFPSVKQLAFYTGQGEKTVRDHLDALDDAGIISRDRHRRDDGTLGRYRFFIHRRNLPVAKFARGEKQPSPAANFATHNPHTNPHTSSLRSEVSRERVPSRFDDFWSLYPNKVGKAYARKKFDKALKVVSFDELMAGLGRYVAKTDDRPWCNPATWLHQERWGDQPADVQPRGSPSRRPPSLADAMLALSEGLTNGQDGNRTGNESDWGDAAGFPRLIEHQR